MELERMKTRPSGVTVLRAAAAMALVAALTACGGGSKTAEGPPECEDGEMLNDAKTACIAKTNDDDNDDDDNDDDGPAELTGKASAASRAALAASETAKKAADMAATVNVIGSGANTALASMRTGDSAKATADAEAVLMARDTIEAQLKIAEDQVTEINRIINGVPSSQADLLEDLRTDLAAARQAVNAIKSLRAGLSDHLQAVRTFHAHGTPELHGKAVATAVRNALQTAHNTGASPVTRVNAGLSGTPGTSSSVPSGSNIVGKIGFEGPPGLMKLVLSEFTDPRHATANKKNKGLSVSGQPLSAFVYLAGGTGTAGDTLTASDVAAVTGLDYLTYKGVTGRLVCQAIASECSGTGGKLSGNAPKVNKDGSSTLGDWFFVPVDPASPGWGTGRDAYIGRYLQRGGAYVEYLDYADYGYWIATNTQGNSDPSDDTVTITATSRSPADWDTTKWTAFTRPGNPKPTTAKYNGKALGIAAVDSFSTSGARSTQSGEFTADVELTAKFDATPSLEGTIDNFGGVAAGRGWSVDLDEAELSGAGRTSNTANSAQTFGEINGERTSSSEVGSWTGQAYGDLPVEQGTHPLGFHGTFWADFKDGRAAGGYAAERIER